ncbi:hypothetical protein RJZ57_002037 [Blastomyces gilchristii]
MSKAVQTGLIVGVSRGIDLEFARQILANGHRRKLALDVHVKEAPDRAKVLTCDGSSNDSITV